MNSTVEDILMEARGYGLRNEVLQLAQATLNSNPKMNRERAYESAYQTLIPSSN
jgi:hypothetical protein|tara:strand:- start:217 stop:378 length:162 start_codon:yes stop_codon:yes gene_type:complete